MPWTESRSRDEWLAEVQRRGTRIRRRRRAGYSVVGALALVLPVSLTATALRTGPERAVELSVAGPAPVGGMVPPPAPPNEVATGDVPAPVATPLEAPTTTVAEVHERVATINGAPGPRSSSPTSVPPADDPVVGRSTAALPVPASGTTASTVPGGLLASSAGAPASPGPALPPCVADEFRLTVSTDKSAYGTPATVKGSAVLEKWSAGTCLLPDWWILVSLLDGTGTDVEDKVRSSRTSHIEDQAEARTCGDGPCRRPVGPGAVFTHTFEWELVDCTKPHPGPVVPVGESNCVPFPPGSYSVVSNWQGPGSGSPARTTFQIGA